MAIHEVDLPLELEVLHTDKIAARQFLHNTWLGQKITNFLWSNVRDDVIAGGEFAKHPETAKLIPHSSIFWWGVNVGIFNYPTDFFALICDGTVTVRVGDVTSLSSHTITISNGDCFESDMLICATGWQLGPTLQFDTPELATKIGPIPHDPKDPSVMKVDREILEKFPILAKQPYTNPAVKLEQPSYELYRGAIPPPFVRTRNFAWCGLTPNLSGTVTAGVQALWITAFLDNRLETPPEMLYGESEIREMAVWHARFWRWRCPMGMGPVMPDMVFEVLPYLDTLLRDLGLKTRRKGGWREIVEPYGASDYAGLIDEWRARGKNID